MFNIDAELRAHKGARWLDRHEPGWFNRVDPDDLDIDSGYRCVWGQLRGRYSRRPKLRLLRREVGLGFYPDVDLGWRWDTHELNCAWRGEIIQRRNIRSKGLAMDIGEDTETNGLADELVEEA